MVAKGREGRRALSVLALVAAALGIGRPAGALNNVGNPSGVSPAQVKLLYVTDDPTMNRTIYSYKLWVSKPSILRVNQSRLTLGAMAGVKAIGAAIGWRTHSCTDGTGTWQYDRQLPYKNYSTFDIEVDSNRTRPGAISYHLYADQETFGSVEGPVALDLAETYQVSGTVFLDADADGVFDPDTEQLIPGVTLSLLRPNGTEVASAISNGGSYNGAGEYLGNYVFDGVERGPYKIVVTDFLGVLSGMRLTSGKMPYAVAVKGDARCINFGYASPN